MSVTRSATLRRRQGAPRPFDSEAFLARMRTTHGSWGATGLADAAGEVRS
jgi:hypothetical protein